MILTRWHIPLAASLLAGAVACGSSTDEGDGSGGVGGSAGSGGSSSSSTSTGTGGASTVGRCRSTDDCDTDNWEDCVAPDAQPCGGACFDPDVTCDADAECQTQGEHYICTPASCTCSGNLSECKEGCILDEDCGSAHLVCDPTHRCIPRPCENDGECPDNFACGPGTDSSCTRETCTSDTDCDDYCVLGRCYDELGWCMQPAA